MPIAIHSNTRGPVDVPKRSAALIHGVITDEGELTSSPVDTNVEEIAGSHDLKTAPLLTRKAYLRDHMNQVINQYGVFGTIIDPRQLRAPVDSWDDDSARLYLNTNTPFSALVCGVQGSGKSHTVSVLLENMFVAGCTALGQLVKPLSGLVLHVGEVGASAAPCEAAYVSHSTIDNAKPPPVRVFVAPSSLKRMQDTYRRLGGNVEVRPLFFSESELDAAAFLSLMAVSSSEGAPLYMQTVLGVLRELGDQYMYSSFMQKLEERKKDMNPSQKAGLKQRLELLQTFTRPGKQKRAAGLFKALEDERRFASGMITIIDLTDPFVDAAMAGGIFEICLRLFQRADVDTGKVLVVDEAHKYLSESNTSNGLTQALLSLVRQQRHMSMRVIVSTQEPTVVPSAFLALCSIVVMHRFSSSAWWEHLRKHVSAKMSSEEAFDTVVTLKTGEAIVACPTGLYMAQGPFDCAKARLSHFGRDFFVARTRKRVTADGGVSLMAVGC
ncbi:hypothetical protein BC834DRAFT_1033285 [Gloeopeniophorella convolvens]|nr:hypothetical protein BC834DRAFT_1033285 [Gloeopeniophorella convolvens]